MKQQTTEQLRVWILAGLHVELDALEARLVAIREAIGTLKPTSSPKPIHWTQTPEGKRRMATIQRKAWRARRNGKA